MSAAVEPRISVLVITRNRAHLLPRLMQALWRQDFPRDRFEVVVIDDGSSDSTREYLAGLGDAVRWFSQSPGGVAKARNASVRQARGSILAFTDDDCVPQPDWLRTIDREMAARQSNAALLGRTYSELPASTFVHSVFKDSEPVVTCNFAVTKDAFQRAGGFDEHFTWYFEDEDLGLRLKQNGCPVHYVPGMVVFHPSRYQGFRQYLRQRSGLQFCFYMNRKHPREGVWTRNRHLFAQMKRKAILFGIPFVTGFIWRPAFAALLAVLALHVALDGWRVWKNYAKLEGTGLRARPVDLLLFASLNWTIPFVDGFQMARGWIRDGLLAGRKQTDRPTFA